MSKLHWHPKTGEAKVFGEDETPPADWLDHHPNDPAHAAPEPAPEPAPKKPGKGEPKASEGDDAAMTKAELTAALKAGGVMFPASATLAELNDLLVNALREALTIRGAEYSEQDGPRKLLALVSAE